MARSGTVYERLFRGALFPIFEEHVKRRHTHIYLREYQDSQWLDRPDLEKLQLRKLNALLAHCWQSVPFLAAFWKEHGLTGRPLQSVAELAGYPTMDKHLITENFDRMRSTNLPVARLTKTTGGSSGDPFRFEYTQESYARRMAVRWRGYGWAGADVGRRTIYLWGAGFGGSASRAKEALYNRFFNWKFLDCFKLTEANAARYVQQIDDFGASVLVGFVGPLLVLAEHMRGKRGKLKHLHSVITAAEPLHPFQRDAIADAFGVPVFDTYGCREVMLIGAECDRHRGLHLSSDHLIVETVDSGDRPVAATPGAVALTDLHNFAMPFVRYRNGDVATLSSELCACGRALPLLMSIEGREVDLIHTADGRILSGLFFPHLMKEFACVREFQLQQKALDELELRLVCRVQLPRADRERITREVLAKVGQDVHLQIDQVESIPLTPSGKRRVTMSDLPPGALRPRPQQFVPKA